jgi:hypothetical protein
LVWEEGDPKNVVTLAMLCRDLPGVSSAGPSR